MPRSQVGHLTHQIHTYPAKLLVNIPRFFLRHKALKSRDPIYVADPFCGSGTVLLEAAILGCNVVGADSNPLARLITRVKLNPPCFEEVSLELVRLKSQFHDEIASRPNVENLDKWFFPHIIEGLSKLKHAIDKCHSSEVKNFMLVCMSVCVRRLSKCDPRLSVPVCINLARKKEYGRHYDQLEKRYKDVLAADVLENFLEIANRNASRCNYTRLMLSKQSRRLLFRDARTLDSDFGPKSVDLIISSPPYLGAQKYIRASSLSIGWLGLSGFDEMAVLKSKSIGREYFRRAETASIDESGVPDAQALIVHCAKEDLLRAKIASQYLVDMRLAIASMYSLLKPGGSAILVCAPNKLRGHDFNTPAYLSQIAVQEGFKLKFALIDHIHSRSLMTRRHKTASVIQSEWIYSLERLS